METMKEQRAREILVALWEIVRDNTCAMDELRDDFDHRRRPCAAIRRLARKAMAEVERAHHRFVQIAEHYGFEEWCVVTRTDNLYVKAVNHCAFFGV